MHLNLCIEVTETSTRHKLWKNMEWIKCVRMPQARIISTNAKKKRSKIKYCQGNRTRDLVDNNTIGTVTETLNRFTIAPYLFAVLMKLRCLTNACDLVQHSAETGSRVDPRLNKKGNSLCGLSIPMPPAIPPAATRQVAAAATNSNRRHHGRTDAPHVAPAAPSAKPQIRVASAHELAVQMTLVIR